MYKVGQMVFSISGIQNEQMLSGLGNFEIDECVPDIDYQVVYVDCLQNIPLDNIIYFNENFAVAKCNNEYEQYYISEKSVYAVIKERKDQYYIYLEKGALNATFHRYFLPTLFCLERTLIYKDSFILHSSYISLDNQGILFTAPSGGGKSTQADLWMKYKGVEILNGDRNIVGKENGKWHVYGTPFSGSSEYCVNRTTSLKAIVILEKGPINIVERLDLKGFSKVFSQTTVNPWDSEFTSKIMDLIMQVCSEVPVYRYSCTKEESAVKELYERFVKDGVLHGDSE